MNTRRAWATSIVLITAAVALLPACLGEPTDPPASDTEAAVSSTPRHGVWVYGASSWVGTLAERDRFMDFVRRYDINDVYVSTENDALLNEEVLPDFLSRLYNNGIRAEALIGDPSWSDLSARDRLLRKVDTVTHYNEGKTDSQRFRGIHLDIEPWIGTQEDLSWVDPL